MTEHDRAHLEVLPAAELSLEGTDRVIKQAVSKLFRIKQAEGFVAAQEGVSVSQDNVAGAMARMALGQAKMAERLHQEVASTAGLLDTVCPRTDGLPWVDAMHDEFERQQAALEK